MSEYISKEIAVEILKEIKRRVPDDLKSCVQATINAINAIPAADVEPVVRGEWVFTEDLENHLWYECSVCKTEYNLKYMHKRCPNCGAHMERSGSGE